MDRRSSLGAVEKPNIVLIMADDLGFECLGSYGGKTYDTPHLDELAGAGMRFEQCHSTPLCSPSRVQLMTGRYPFRTGWVNLIGRGKEPLRFLDPNERTFGHLLRDYGYSTGIAGKWQLCDFVEHPNHLGDCGFDEHCCWAWVYGGKKTSRYWNPSIIQNGELRQDYLDSRYGPDVYCDFIIDFMTRHRSRPFFAYYPMTLTHNPPHKTPDTALTAEDRRGDKRGEASDFAGMVAYMDKLVGRIVSALERLQLREKTLILFTGDNGTPRNYVSLLGDEEVAGGKGRTTDAGTHVPLIANWPGVVRAGAVCEDLIDFSDFMPTVAELADAPLGDEPAIDGRSFLPQLRGRRGNPRKWVFAQLGDKRCVRTERWKLQSDGRMYDMAKDPFELGAPIDVEAAGPDVVAARKALTAALTRLQ